MTKIYYFPGCTYLRSKNEDVTARAMLEALGSKVEDIPNWTCCGATFPSVNQFDLYWIFPFRNLLNASIRGIKEVLVTCPFCYRNLSLANKLSGENEEKIKVISDLMEEEYSGDVKIVHLLQYLKEYITLEKISECIKRNLKLKVVAFYGCALLRPREIAVDSHERPTIMEEILKVAGCESLDFYPTKIKCCGNYLSITSHNSFINRVYNILNHANEIGAQAIVTMCSLCHYNLDAYQGEIQSKFKGFNEIPILHLTQLLSLALGLPPEICHFSDHKTDPRPHLKKWGVI